MDYAPEEYTRHYIVEALFKLMGQYEYDKISVTDVAAKAGVGRATFYRYFKRKEDVIEFYFTHNVRAFISERRYYPRYKADYLKIARDVFEKFKNNRERFILIKRARLEYLYLDFLNKKMVETFENEYPENNLYQPYLYAGMLFNVSMAWLDGGCAEPVEKMAQIFIDSLNIPE